MPNYCSSSSVSRRKPENWEHNPVQSREVQSRAETHNSFGTERGQRQSRLITKRCRCRRRINPLIKVTSKAAPKAIKASEQKKPKRGKDAGAPCFLLRFWRESRTAKVGTMLSPLPLAYLWPFFAARHMGREARSNQIESLNQRVALDF